VASIDVPEAFAVDQGVVYVFDEVARAFDLDDGDLKWEVGDPEEYPLAASGGVLIGQMGPRRIRMWAPFESDLIADRETGALVRLGPAGPNDTKPAGMRVFSKPRPTKYRVKDNSVDRFVARYPNGTVAWRLHVDEPMYETGSAVGVPGGVVLMTSNGWLVALDDI
jgi:hypothetical protein